MEFSYENVMRLLDTRLTTLSVCVNAKLDGIFGEESCPHTDEYAEHFANRCADLARYSGAMHEVGLILSCIQDMNKS